MTAMILFCTFSTLMHWGNAVSAKISKSIWWHMHNKICYVSAHAGFSNSWTWIGILLLQNMKQNLFFLNITFLLVSSSTESKHGEKSWYPTFHTRRKKEQMTAMTIFGFSPWPENIIFYQSTALNLLPQRQGVENRGDACKKLRSQPCQKRKHISSPGSVLWEREKSCTVFVAKVPESHDYLNAGEQNHISVIHLSSSASYSTTH